MRIIDGELLHSASDLNTYLGCPHATALHLRRRRFPESVPPLAADSAQDVLVAKAGLKHEADYLDALRQGGAVAEISGDGGLDEQEARTIAAMREGAPIIFQAMLRHGPWHGYIDFLRRVEQPAGGLAWSYEPVDTKLARREKASHLVQLSLYARLLEAVQGRAPDHVHLVLGDGTEESFPTSDFAYVTKAAANRYLAFIVREDAALVASGDELPPPAAGEPCGACKRCGWREHCAAEWERTDHLSRVAGINKGQIAKLKDADILTIEALAEASETTRVARMAPETFAKLQAQARLQRRGATEGPLPELLVEEPGRGLLRLPEPNPADLFFDLEGDPLTPGGLEYLWGVHYRDGGEPSFRFWWAHDREAERAAFEQAVDWFMAHVEAHPGAHIYHYASYEVRVLRKLSQVFATREDAVDTLLRQEKFVDLYSVVRQGIRTSERNLSLKTLETFFAEKRGEEVKDAGQSIVVYNEWRREPRPELLQQILDYNHVDCVNTEGLRDWLLTLRPGSWPWWQRAVHEERELSEKQLQAAERRAHEKAEHARLRESAVETLASSTLDESIKETLAQLVDFHRRARKPLFWAMFDRAEAPTEKLLNDLEAIASISPAGVDWLGRDKRSDTARYSFPPQQETKLREGNRVLHAPSLMSLGEIIALDTEAGSITVKRQLKPGEAFPETGSIIGGGPLDDEVIEAGCWRTIRTLAEGQGPSSIRDLLERRPPRMTGATQGQELVRGGEPLIESATRCTLALKESLLFIQGPPGTGKTHSSAHVIVSLIQSGQRVAITSNSHKAIDNLLLKAAKVAAERGVRLRAAKKISMGEEDEDLKQAGVVQTKDNAAIEDGDWDLVGGTAFLFARPGLAGRFDTLFVDEAGQVSLGNMLAIAPAARNLILVGDQMQLSQPVQGEHPGDSGLSALDYLLQGEPTIAPDRGIFLDESWRMHPSICEFISSAVYEGRLRSHPDCSKRRLHLRSGAHPALKPCGISVLPISHEGCGQTSEAEALQIRDLIDELIGTPFTSRDGTEGVIGLSDILVVAPYNAQVNLLKRWLPDGARVGTVDKFQGQEAEVVLVSLTSSSPEELPRQIDFFYSKNRLNVAISRGRTLAVLLMNPRLLELQANSANDLRLVNTLAWANAYAQVDHTSQGN